MSTKPKMPAGLGAAGKALWREFTSVYRFDVREHLVLAAAARQADLVAELEALLRRDGVAAMGSQGQPRMHPAVAELRQGRLALSRLLAELRLPDPDGAVVSPRSRHAQKAANARWSQTRLREQRLRDASGG